MASENIEKMETKICESCGRDLSLENFARIYGECYSKYMQGV